MRKLQPWLRQLLDNGGPFIGINKAQSRVTVEPSFYLTQSSGAVGIWPAAKLPLRWYQREDNSQVEVEIPNVKSVQIVRDLNQTAATLDVEIFNTTIPANGVAQNLPSGLGDPGFFSWNYGSTDRAQSLWNQTPNMWANVLRENALIRVYQGYGGAAATIPQAVAAGNLLLTGVFLLDSPAIESNGITKLHGRDMAKLLIDQQTVPPLIPPDKYPLNYYGPNQGPEHTLAAVPGYGTGSWAQARCTYGNSSAAAIIGAGPAAAAAALALDQDHNTYWTSEQVGSGAASTNYVVVAGDTLWSIAQHFYGATTMWPTIYQANSTILSGIYPSQFLTIVGTTLVIPSVGSPTAQVWIELLSGEEVTGVYIDPFLGDYNCYVSVMVNGSWVGGSGTTAAGIPYVEEFRVPFETPGWRRFPNRYITNKVRLTFSALAQFSGGYIAGMRGVQLGTTALVSNTDKVVLGIQKSATGNGYRLVGSDGGVFDYGDAIFYGSFAGHALNAGMVGIAHTGDDLGYWLAAADGGVFSFGDAAFHGSVPPTSLNAPVVSFEATSTGNGYACCAADGGIFCFGDATFHGSLGSNIVINMVDFALRPQNDGYWILGEDGSVHAFGSAQYYGGENIPSSQEEFYTAFACTPTGNGYWMATDLGAVYAFGDAKYYGGQNTNPVTLQAPISGMDSTPSGQGYRLCSQDGGVFDFGDAVFYGSLPAPFTYHDPADYSDYCLDEQSEAFTKRGWLSHAEMVEGDEVLGVDYETGQGCWHRVEGVYRRHRSREMVALRGASFDALTTPEHRWLVKFGDDRLRWTTSDALRTSDLIPLTVPPDHLPTRAVHSDAFVELVAWFWTEGSWGYGRKGEPFGAELSQSRTKNPENVAEIERLLKSLYGEPGPMPRGAARLNINGPWWNTYQRVDSGVVLFNLAKKVADQLRVVCDKEKAVAASFLLELTAAQLELFITRSLLADGSCNKDRRRAMLHHTSPERSEVIAQRSEARIRSFEIACVLAGHAVVTHECTYKGEPMWSTTLLKCAEAAPVRSAHQKGRATVAREWYEGVVWCPQTELGNFVARRNGSIYLTGNSQIIVDLALWSGFWLLPPVAQGNGLPGSKPAVYGNIETTGGAYDTIGPLGINFFDKRPVIDVMKDIAGLVSYLIRVDEEGGFRFESPNVWSSGNYYEDGTPTNETPVIDEKVNLSDYIMTQTDQDLRSPIIVSILDPFLQGANVSPGNITTFVPPYTPLLKGISKPAVFAVPLQVGAQDQQFFAELIALRIWFQSRTGQITAWCDPSICVNDQVRIYERNTSETNTNYCQAITTNHDTQTGKFEMHLTTYWLGGRDNWAVTSDLNSFFGPGTTRPTTTYNPGDPAVVAALNQYVLSNSTATALGSLGVPTTQVFNVQGESA